MKVTVYSIKDFERAFLSTAAEKSGHVFNYVERALGVDTASLSSGSEAAMIFAGDDASGDVLRKLSDSGVRYLAIRAAGYDNVDLEAARILNLRVANVPAYSPHAIAEHAVALILGLNRKLTVADKQVHAYNFSVGNLVGFDLFEKVVGIVGTGKTGSVAARILHGFGCRLIAYDIQPDSRLTSELGIQYCDLESLCRQSDIITLHTYLNKQTHHMIDAAQVEQMKPGVMLINTSRGAVVNTAAIIDGLEKGRIGSYGADVYERERGVFFYDRSKNVPDDAMLRQLLHMPNVLITPHQAFATNEALRNIAETTCYNIDCWAQGRHSSNELWGD